MDWKKNMTPEQKEHARKMERARWMSKTKDERRKKFASRSPEQRRKYQLKKDYGITLEQYDQMFEAQGYCCANQGCRAKFANTLKGWHVDHDHLTGKVRGILCSNCNVALGHAQDNADRLFGLAVYIKNHEGGKA